MGSEGGIRDFNLPVHVAVGRNVKEGKSLLTWAAESFPESSISLVHVHQPTISVSPSSGKLSGRNLKSRAIKAWQELERSKMEKHLSQYLFFLSQMGKQVDKVWIETRNIEEGILKLIIQHRIMKLVMGAGAETFNTKKSKEINFTKAMVVHQQAPQSCHIWFVSKGCLVHERPAYSSQLAAAPKLPPSTIGSGATLTCDSEENMDANAGKVQHFEHPTGSVIEVESTYVPSASTVTQTRRYEAPLKLESPQHLSCSASSTSLDSEFEEDGACDVRNKLRLWRAEENALEAIRKAEDAESLCKEEIDRRREVEEQLLRQSEEMKKMKNQHEQSLKELQLIEDQMPVLKSYLREAHYSEKELEERIIQAVNLLITFKGTRDELQRERDSAMRKINKYKALKADDSLGMSSAHFFEIPFSYIVEATEDFNPSQKIGEGRYGSVFKAILSHVKVAIKMLPSSGSQSDWEFKNEAEVLCRVRHPNLATLLGVCPESRSLIYEYIENGSLEDYLSTSGKAHFLSWQTRIRISDDICSALLFLHNNNSCSVHGNLNTSNILLDGNFVTKLSDFGIYNLISQNENPCSLSAFNDPEKSAYMDPESVESGLFTTKSDIYSFGVILLRLLTARPASGVVRDVKCALERGNLDTILDASAGDWPLGQVEHLANLALMCCQSYHLDRSDVLSEIWTALKDMKELSSTSSHSDSRSQHKIPSHFVCPIYQEVMKDPHVAPDGFTYEGEAIKGWFNSGHKTSPMTNLKLENCDLLPNYALYYAIQEWQHNT